MTVLDVLGRRLAESWLSWRDWSLPSSPTRSILKEVGTGDEFVIVISLVAVLPIRSSSKFIISVLMVMKGYLPMAETLSERVHSWLLLISLSLMTMRATCTLASSALNVMVKSCFLPGCKTPIYETAVNDILILDWLSWLIYLPFEWESEKLVESVSMV